MIYRKRERGRERERERTPYILFVIIFLNSILASCKNLSTNNGNIIMVEKNYVTPRGCAFNVIENNSELKSECSPELIDQFPKENFQGILINSNPEIVWPKNVELKDMAVLPNGNIEGSLKLMVAGLVNLPYNTLNL